MHHDSDFNDDLDDIGDAELDRDREIARLACQVLRALKASVNADGEIEIPESTRGLAGESTRGDHHGGDAAEPPLELVMAQNAWNILLDVTAAVNKANPDLALHLAVNDYNSTAPPGRRPRFRAAMVAGRHPRETPIPR